jgi:predicted Zn-dependent protease
MPLAAHRLTQSTESRAMTFGRILLAALTPLVIGACASTPVTGRKQLMLVSEDSAIAASQQAYQEMLAPYAQKGRLNNDPALRERVEAITARLIPPAVEYRPETAQWDWQITVIDDPETLNAWAMAGGKMAIYTGIIQKLALTDDEIAQIMGHEIAHALAKHTAERMSVAVASDAAASIAGAVLGERLGDPQLTQQGLSAAAAVALQLPNSRGQETEADRIGIELAARAGYNPEAAVSLWQKMIRATGNAGRFDFLSTHPASEKRVEALQELAVAMMPLYRNASPSRVYSFSRKTISG